MSSKTLTIFSESFDSYADALYKYLENKGIEKVWLAEKITPKGKKVASTQEKLSRWKREGSKPAKETRRIINEILSVSIYQNENGRWVISRTNDPTTRKINLLKQKVDDEGVDYSAQVQLLEYLEGRTESLSQELSEMHSIMKRLRLSMQKNPSDD